MGYIYNWKEERVLTLCIQALRSLQKIVFNVRAVGSKQQQQKWRFPSTNDVCCIIQLKLYT